MNALRKPISAVQGFFGDEVSARSLAVFRIVFSCYYLYYLISIYWMLELNYSDHGALAGKVGDFLIGRKFSVMAWFAGSATVFHFLWVLSLCAGLALAIGLFTPIAAVLLWVLHVSWMAPMPVGDNGGDNVVTILTFLFMVSSVAGHAQAYWSMDRQLGARYLSWTPRDFVPAWSTRLFQLQLVLVYFFAGFHKAASQDWYKGTAVQYVYQQRAWSQFNTSWMSSSPTLIAAITYGTLLFELLIFPVLVWPKSTRLWVLAAGVAFHLGIGATVRIHTFGEIMPIFYLCFCGDEIADLTKRLVPKLRVPGLAHS